MLRMVMMQILNTVTVFEQLIKIIKANEMFNFLLNIAKKRFV